MLMSEKKKFIVIVRDIFTVLNKTSCS